MWKFDFRLTTDSIFKRLSSSLVQTVSKIIQVDKCMKLRTNKSFT